MLYKDHEAVTCIDGTEIGKNVIWRYWCECGMTDHVLEFSYDENLSGTDELMIRIYSNPEMGFFRRLWAAIKLVFGKQHCYQEVVLHPDDRKELAVAIDGEQII